MNPKMGQLMKPKMLNVFAADVFVGSIPEEEYKAIRKEVRADRYLWLLQGISIAKDIVNILTRATFLTPVVWLLLLFMIAFLHPEELTAAVAEALNAPSVFASGLRHTIAVAMALSFTAIVVSKIINNQKPAFWDVLDAAVHKRIRQHLGVATEARLTVVEMGVQTLGTAVQRAADAK